MASSRKDVLIVPLLEQFENKLALVNLITGKAGALLSRIQSEGVTSPADVLVTVDAGNLRAKRRILCKQFKVNCEITYSLGPTRSKMNWVG